MPTETIPGVNANHHNGKKVENVDVVVIRFCGDSGDGMQLV